MFLTPVATMAGLALTLASLLVLANHWLQVVEDPRTDAVEGMLPHTNCGACGYPGCRAFAEALVAGETLPGKCSVSSPAGRERIAAFLGVAVGTLDKQIARLACAGGLNVARRRARYQGVATCGAAAVAGGGKGCFWGCLGYGDCDVACTFDAITMNDHGLPVVDEQKCTGCGDCVTACPKDLFSLQPQSQRLWVACRSQEAGEEILEDCQVACTACERCAMDAPELIQMSHNLPVIDASRMATPAPIARCPTGAIVWLDEHGRGVKGPAARKIVRHDPLHDRPT